MVSLVRGTFCPRCTSLVYRLEGRVNAASWIHIGAELASDGEGWFVACPYCRRRIGLRPAPHLPGWGFEVDTRAPVLRE